VKGAGDGRRGMFCALAKGQCRRLLIIDVHSSNSDSNESALSTALDIVNRGAGRVNPDNVIKHC